MCFSHTDFIDLLHLRVLSVANQLQHIIISVITVTPECFRKDGSDGTKAAARQLSIQVTQPISWIPRKKRISFGMWNVSHLGAKLMPSITHIIFSLTNWIEFHGRFSQGNEHRNHAVDWCTAALRAALAVRAKGNARFARGSSELFQCLLFITVCASTLSGSGESSG